MTDYPNNTPAKLEIIKESEITQKEVRGLWYPYIPFGKVTLLQGDPGDGKSKMMLSLAALLSKGAPLPFADEEEHTEPMSSYIGDTCSMNNANETRAEFNHLIAVAKDTGCAIVIIAHMNKAKDTNPLYRTPALSTDWS